MKSKHHVKFSFIALITLLLSACGTNNNTVSSLPTSTLEIDPDVVYMAGTGEEGKLNSLTGLKPMSLEELTACSNKIVQLDKDNQSLKIEQVKRDHQKKDLTTEGNNIELARVLVDVHSMKSVNTFNGRLEKYHAMVKQINTDINETNQKANAINTLNNSFNISCANRAYRRSDFAKLSKELRDAVQSHSKKSDIPVIEEPKRQENKPAIPLHLNVQEL